MMIEFLGTPGAGKSTLSLGAVKDLRSQGCQVLTIADAKGLVARRTPVGRLVSQAAQGRLQDRILQRLLEFHLRQEQMRFGWAHRDLARHVLATQRERPPEADIERRNIIGLFHRITGYYGLLHRLRRQDEMIVFNEAFVHRVVHFNVSEWEQPDRSRIRAYLERVPCEGVVIHVQASFETCYQRVLRRGVWGHSRHKSKALIARFIENAHAVVKIALDILREQGRDVLTVDNSRNDPSIARAAINAGLNKRFDLTAQG